MRDELRWRLQDHVEEPLPGGRYPFELIELRLHRRTRRRRGAGLLVVAAVVVLGAVASTGGALATSGRVTPVASPVQVPDGRRPSGRATALSTPSPDRHGAALPRVVRTPERVRPTPTRA